MTRPLMQLGVGELEALFANSKTEVKVLKQLEHELQFRQMPRAVALLADVQAAMYSATPEAPKPGQAEASEQRVLLERPATVAASLAAAPITAVRPEKPVKAPDPAAAPKTPQSDQPEMSVDEAYKLLKATASSTWESIEQTRRHLVQQAHPDRLKSMDPERQTQVLAEAKRVNTAYVTVSQARRGVG